MNREEKIKAIYKKIANKELTNGCKIIRFSGVVDTFVEFEGIEKGIKYTVISGLNKRLITTTCTLQEFEEFIIIGHKVLIGDYIYYMEKYIKERRYDTCVIVDTEIWNKPNRPIEEQSEECIDYVYNLPE